jgi:hypothetical protein
MKSNSSGRRLLEALYDLESGKTFVRHPEKEEWVESSMLKDVLKGNPVASVSSRDECDVYPSMPHGRKKGTAKKSTLMMTYQGHFSELDRR